LICILIIFFLLKRRKQTGAQYGAPNTFTESVAANPVPEFGEKVLAQDNIGGRLSEPEEPHGGRLRYPNDEVDVGGRLQPDGVI
jgi:hypothetical protein